MPSPPDSVGAPSLERKHTGALPTLPGDTQGPQGPSMREQVPAHPSSQGCRTRDTSSLHPCWAPVSLPPVAAVTHAAVNTGVQTPAAVPALGLGRARPQVALAGLVIFKQQS